MLSLLKRLLRGGRHRTNSQQGSRRARLSLESLEDRLTPSATAQQEYMLQLVNRMRTNPAAELPLLLNSNDTYVNSALSYFNVNRQTLAQQWATLTPVAPLAWSDALALSATNHSTLMLADAQQAHQLTGEADPGTRMATAGYGLAGTFAWGENIFAYSHSVYEGHAALAIDWGQTSTGIQSPPGHRENLMSTTFRQIGIGLVNGTNGSVGPLLITQDFGGPVGSGNPFLVGAVFSDGNGNGYYDRGEGLSGVTLTISGGSGTFTAITGIAGDYQLRLPSGTYSVMASGGGLGSTSLTGSVTVGSSNVLLNLNSAQGSVSTPTPLTTPTVTGPTGIVSTSTPTISWTASTGADHYEVMVNDTTTGQMGIVDQTNLTTTSNALSSALLAGHRYSTQVRAFDSTGNPTSWSKLFAFSIVTPPGSSVTGPTGTILNPFPTITWTASNGADHYELKVMDSSAAKMVIDAVNLTSLSLTPSSPLTAGHLYTAMVRAFNSAGQTGAWGLPHSFMLVAPSAPLTITPTGLITNPMPTINWSASKGADHYELEMLDISASRAIVTDQTNLTSLSAALTTPLTTGHQYLVMVRAFNSANQNGAWGMRYFTLLAPAIPRLTGPIAPVGLLPSFTWTASPDAAYYELRVNDLTTHTVGVIDQTNLTQTSFMTSSSLVHGHLYSVQVQAFNSLGKSRGWSLPLVFKAL